MTIHKVASLKTAEAFGAYLKALGVELPFDAELLSGPASPLAQPLSIGGLTAGNRFAVLPMEGWDGTLDGHPSELTFRRWQRFGLSGAGLVWGGEAVAVRPDGRANPNQLVINRETLPDLAALRAGLVACHTAAHGMDPGLVIGLQLTHSGRFCRPYAGGRPAPRLAYDHPWLNPRFGLPLASALVFSDGELDDLAADFIRAAALAREAGFDFVDIKHCHGYLAHELLSAVDRPGKYGGNLENRTRFLREVIAGIQSKVPGLQIGVRLSAIDFMPFRPGPDGIGVPDLKEEDIRKSPPVSRGYRYAFGGDGSGLGIDLTEPLALVRMLVGLGVRLVCVTAGSPYYNPHIQRPAYFPPSDGYQLPEDPLIGVARQVGVTAEIKARCPEAIVVGSAYSCLQEWLPNVAQAAVRRAGADFAGLGRMMLAYPSMPADILAGRPLQRKQICRTFSDCTTAPRSGLVSGCYPLDAFYHQRPEAKQLEAAKSKTSG